MGVKKMAENKKKESKKKRVNVSPQKVKRVIKIKKA